MVSVSGSETNLVITYTTLSVDHALLLTRLQRSFGVESGCLA